MPEGNLRLSDLPAQEDALAVTIRREVDEPDLRVPEDDPVGDEGLHLGPKCRVRLEPGAPRDATTVNRDPFLYLLGGADQFVPGFSDALETRHQHDEHGVGFLDREQPLLTHPATTAGNSFKDVMRAPGWSG